MSRSTALWRAPARFWFLLLMWLIMLQTLSGDIMNVAWQLAGLLLITALLSISFAGLVGVLRDPRLVILTDHGLRFRALNTVYRSIPWSRIDTIEVGPSRDFCLVHFNTTKDRPKTIRLPLNLLDGSISERLLAALQQFPVEVRQITGG